ncbi:MAG TPA: FtsW/RodA/SpoVE family cell cycle protein [Candidatus Saccharimonadales bacterium]|nr:FtsW/RodA/SpoVE family cell cycle protein [Candidatus Saccharimonadales bacterium]
MNIATSGFKKDLGITISALILVVFSIIVLRAIAPFVFPGYFIYLIVAVICFLFFSQVGFDILSAFSNHFYIGSVIFLILPLIIGQVTRGVVRWIPIGPIQVQPSELVRPFLFVFFANELTHRDLKFNKFVKITLLFLIVDFLILVQPSLGVSVLTAVGYLGIVLATTFDKKKLLLMILIGVILAPLFWFFLKPYQRERIISFDNYNSIQAMISVGSGKISGKGLGRGTETQLAFLPEKQTDFVFASIGEELGFVGAGLVLLVSFFLLFRISQAVSDAYNPASRSFISGVFMALLFQVFVHVGMNMGILPITGVTLPLVSAGGSSLVATAIALGMVVGSKK